MSYCLFAIKTEESYCLDETEEDAVVLADACSVQTCVSGTSKPRTVFIPFCEMFQATVWYHAGAH